jgi:uncharacterized membrane protein YhaH (DUF805 family)
MNTYFAVLKKYGGFSGRARRSEYWVFAIINTLVSYGLLFIDLVILGIDYGGIGPLSSVYTLLVFLPLLAVTVRRLHDTGRSGLWLFIIFIPLVGAIVVVIFMATDSQRGPNKYGPYPKDVSTIPAS